MLEVKLSLETECNSLRHRNDSLASQLTSLHSQHASEHSQHLATISSLQAELHIKSHELTSLGVLLEQRLDTSRQLEFELAKSQNTVLAYQKSLAQVEREKEEACSRLEREWKSSQERLEAYEVLETEIDDVIMRTARQQSSNGCGGAQGKADTGVAGRRLS